MPGLMPKVLCCAATLIAAQPALAQQPPVPGQSEAARPAISSPVLTIDSERLFLESAFGKRVAAEIESKGAELATENRQIEADLEAEEKRITEQRDTLSAEEFREIADAFDEKVQRTRQEQAAKGRALNDLLDQEREVFLNAAGPVLERLMRESGAAVILERRSVFVSATAIEITEDAIRRLDETLGSGAN